MLQPYPDAAQVPEIQWPAPPPSVLNAVKVMYAGAAASVVLGIIYVVTAGATKAAIEQKNPQWSAGTLSTVTHAAVTIGAVVGLIAAALWIWIARSSKSGKNWARVTGTVFCVIAVLGSVYDLASPVATAVRIFNFVVLLIGLVAVALLWQRTSSAYFKFFKRPQF